MATIQPRLHLIDRKAPDAHSSRRCRETQVSVAPAALGPRGTFWGASSSKGVGWGSQEGNKLFPAVSRLQNQTNGTPCAVQRELSLEPAQPRPLTSAGPGRRDFAGPRQAAPALGSGGNSHVYHGGPEA